MSELYKKASVTFIIKILGLGIGFAFQIILGRTLQAEIYGKYTMFITYANIINILIVLGMDRNLIKEVAKLSNKKIESFKLFKFALKMSSILFLLISIFVLIFYRQLEITSDLVYLFLITLIIKAIICLVDGYLQGIGMVTKVTFFNVLFNNILKFVTFIMFFKIYNNGLYSAILSFIISEVICIVLRGVFIKRYNKGFINTEFKISNETKRKFIKYSLTLVLISSIGIMMQNVDKLMITKFISFESVGIYKVVQNYVMLIGIFITPFIAFWPVISKLYGENKILEIEVEMKKIVKIVTSMVIPMFFIFFFLNEKLLLIFGNQYVSYESKNVLLILSFAFLFDAISGPIGSILNMTNYAKYALINNVVCLVLNVVLNFIFIKMYGIIGVAIGTGISIIVNNLISIIEVKILLGIFAYNFGNLIQIILFSLGNFILGSWLIQIIKFQNLYIYIIAFSIVIYLVNFISLIFINKKLILEKFDK
ncbi:oligosaccharide flippase family protein [Oceanirhabdus sp. W0125-5]|uniref:oligosaccharide flippase family protein n=1 Tax=Oceanirhabdus sp. W0125-5 TaxID=2999116 RepID=UPI0022F338AE|nr:oligosaccharide flippase family protein [Oceanirhabdus sp. W0125-5]WBW98666.1 oligosaccharide flippase family protein [Oceanirhabdus sp. W0125-5]